MMRSNKGGRIAIVAVALLAAFGAEAEALYSDFTQGELPSGWFASEGKLRSPEYGSAVDRIELRYSGADADASATVQAFPANGEGVDVATFTAASSGASFDFPETTDFRSFSITTNGLGISSFTAYVSESFLATPSGVAISNNVTGTSFDAYWNPVADATGYRVYVWTNIVTGASAGTEVWQETMPGATNASSSTKLTDAKFNACFEHAGWTRSDKAGYPTGEDGTLRIGTSGDNGWIQTPAIHHAVGGMAVRFQAKANATNTKSMDIAVERVSGETVTLAGTATLTTEMQEFSVALSDWKSGDSIRFNSITNSDRRTIIGTVVVIAGISAGHSEPVYIVNELDVGAATGYSFSGLPSVPVSFAVEAYGRRGVSSAKTDAVVVDLSNPDPVPVLNAYQMSSLVGNTYTQNFDSLAPLTTTSSGVEWLNGTTLTYWQSFQAGSAVESVEFYKGGNATGIKFLALATNENDHVRALGARVNKDTRIEWGLTFTNDTDVAKKLVGIYYDAEQWGFANTGNVHQAMTLSYLVTNRIDWIANYSDGWNECVSTEAPCTKSDYQSTPEVVEVKFVPETAIDVPPGWVIVLKWSLGSPTSGNSALMGIDDVTVTFEPAARPLSITFR